LRERAAHGLKGSVANFCARAAEDAAFHLEQLGRSQKLGEAPQALAALTRTLSLLRAELASL
jgi:HPt (histidine-containing phosphotransfer) domain-containing protein